MFSILDILKKHREEKKKTAGQGDTAAPGAASPSIFFNEDIREHVSVSTALNKEFFEEGMRRLSGVYADSVAFCKKFYACRPEDAPALKAELETVVSRIITEVSGGSRASLRYFFRDYPDMKEFMYYHAVNVCLLTVEFGLGLGYESGALRELAKTSLLHEIGMIPLSQLQSKPGPLSPEEAARLKGHPEAAARLIDSMGFSRVVSDAILFEHERCDASGYPRGVKGEGIPEAARIIGLADAYEAMVHARPFRPARSPSAAINAILDMKSGFDARAIKVLIERVGIFPEGTRIRLNTRETGVVVKVNPLSPLRPVVSVLTDSRGGDLPVPKEINLCKNYLIHIVEENAG